MTMEWLDRIHQMQLSWWVLLVVAAWRALPLILIATILGFALRRKLSPSIHAFLWTIVIARFLIPISLESSFSLHNPLRYISSWEDRTNQIQAVDLNVNREAMSLANPGSSSEQSMKTQAPTENDFQISFEGCMMFALFSIFSVSMLLVCRSFISHRVFVRELKRCKSVDNSNLMRQLEIECKSLGIRRCPQVVEVPELATPAVFGIFRHTICLPSGLMNELSDEEARWIIRHELAHIKRWDSVIVMIASIASSIHWFNPLVWFSQRRLRCEIESAADQIALTGTTPKEAHMYGHLLLRLAEKSNSKSILPALGLLPFASGKQLKRRVNFLMQPSWVPTGRMKWLLMFACSLMAFMGLTDAQTGDRPPVKPAIHLPSMPMGSYPTPLPAALPAFDEELDDNGPQESRAYDVNKLLQTIPQPLTSTIIDPKERLAKYIPWFHRYSDHFQVLGTELIANVTPKQHDVLKQTIELWEQGEPRQICIEGRIAQVTLKQANTINWTERYVNSLRVGSTGVAIAVKRSKQDVGDLLDRMQSDRRTNIQSQPKVVVFDGQSAFVQIGTRHPFVTGIKPNDAGVMEPVVTTVEEGLKVIARPVTQPNSDVIKFSFEVEMAKIESVDFANLPIVESQSNALHTTIQVPRVRKNTVHSSVDLKSSESIIIAIPEVFTPESDQASDLTNLVILTPTVVKSSGHSETEGNK
jgi:bla regulator protein blaR1